MTRKKLKLAYIPSDSMRKSTFNKRKKGFMKKLHELSVLCDIEACAVIYSQFSSNPEVWPSSSGVKSVVEKFEKLPEMEQQKKMVNHEGFLRQSIAKTMENNNKKMKENKERAMKEVMFQFLGGKRLKLTDKNCEDLCKYIDQYLKELYHHRNQTLNPQSPHLEYGESSSSAANYAMAPPSAIAEVGSSSRFPNPGVFNPPQLSNELWGLRPVLSSNPRQEQVYTFGDDFAPAPSDQQGYYQLMNPVGVYDHQHPILDLNHDQYCPQQFGYPIVSQDDDGFYNQSLQEEWLVGQMMKHPDQEMRSPMVDEKNHYYHHHP